MSAIDISAIPKVSDINVPEFKEPYRKIIRLLPRIAKLANNVNPNITLQQKQERMDRLKAVFDSYLDDMRKSLGTVPESDPVFTDFPET